MDETLKKVREVMTPTPTVVGPDATLQAAAQRMVEADCGFLPIMGPGNLLVGVLTDRDIVVRAIARGLDPATTTVSAIATFHVRSLDADETIDTALMRMEQYQIRRLPVTDKGVLCGVVALGDLAEAMPDQAEDVLVEVSRSPKTLAHRPDTL